MSVFFGPLHPLQMVSYQTLCTMPTQGVTVKVPPGDMAVQFPCFLVLNINGWNDFLSNPVLPFHKSE